MRRTQGKRRGIAGQARVHFSLEGLETRVLLAADWQNPSNAYDVDGSEGPDAVSPLDALIVINELQSRAASSPVTGLLPDLGPEEGSPPPFLDVNGDNIVSPLDALLVINQLQQGASPSTTSTFAGPTDRVMAGTVAANFIVTSDTLVNDVTAQAQSQPDVASTADGRAVVVWASFDQDGSSWGIYAQRYNAIGEKVGGEFRVNTHTRGSQREPAVAMDSNGAFMVVWQSLGEDSSSWGVFGRQFDANGIATSDQILIPQTTRGLQWHPDVSVLASGGYVVAWDGRGSGDGDGVFTRTFNSTGQATSAEILANTTTRGGQSYPAVASRGTGAGFTVAWQGKGPGDDWGVFLRDSVGTSEILVNTDTSRIQSHPAISGDAGGNLVVAWQEFPEPGGGNGVRARSFGGTSLAATSGVLVVNQTSTGPQHGPAVALLNDGGFAAAWYGNGSEDNVGIYQRVFSATGVAETDELLANTTTKGSQVRPSIANIGGDFGVVWTGRGEGDRRGIFARLFDVVDSGNRAPTLVSPIADQEVDAGTPFSLNITSSFSDPDAGDTLAYTATTANGGALPAWLTFNTTTGQFSGTPTATDIGTTQILVRATDGSGASVDDTFALTVNPVNLAPIVTTPIPDQTATIATPFTLDVTSAFSDPNGDPLTFTTSTLPAWLSFNAATQVFTGTPDHGDEGSVNVQVTATDPGGLSATDTFALTVNATNRAPVVVTPIPDQTLLAGQSLNLDVTANFSDPDVGDTLSFTATQVGGGALPAWLSFNAATQVFSGTPAATDVGTTQVVVTAEDQHNASVSDTFSITVESFTNGPPVLFDQTFRVAPTATVGTTVGTVQASDPNHDPLTYAITAGNGSGAFTIDPSTGAITVADATALAGLTEVALTVQATDDGTPALSGTATVTVFVTAADPAVEYSIEFFSPSGATPITGVPVGGTFVMKVFVQDIRATPAGVFSAFTDVIYASNLVTATGTIVHSSTYGGGTSGNSSTAGLLDEAGGVDGTSALGGDRFEVFRITMQAGTTLGTAFFTTDVADNTITHPTLLFGTTSNLDTSLIVFSSASLPITEVPQGRSGPGLNASPTPEDREESVSTEQLIAQVFAEASTAEAPVWRNHS